MPPRQLSALIVTVCWLVGCSKPSSDFVTYHRDVAPIVFTHCANCHRSGAAAPFNLLTYADVKARDSQIVDLIQQRLMPPWLPEPGHIEFVGERRLSDADIATFKQWVDKGSPEGDPSDSPPMPQFKSDWELGEPDLVIESPKFELSAAGKDRFRNFVLQVPLKDNQWVRAVELRPLNPRVTHHVRLGMDVSGESVRRDAADPDEGYEGMAWGADLAGDLVTWTPGMQPRAEIENSAWQLYQDSTLVLHTHLQPSGKVESVGFRIGLHFADTPPTVHPLILRVGGRNIDIPANATRHVVRDSYELPINVDLISIFPHAHSLCREIVVEAVSPDADPITLIAIKNFDENWHDNYLLSEPLPLTKGTRIVTQMVYDNSSANTRNPNHPPQRVVYGSNASDEMCDVSLRILLPDPEFVAILREHYEQYDLASKVIGYSKSLELHPEDLWSHDALMSTYVASNEPAKSLEHWKKHKDMLANSVHSRLIYAMSLLRTGQIEPAEAELHAIVVEDDQLATGWVGLGQSLAMQDKPHMAEEALRKAIAIAPRFTIARLDLIDILSARGKTEQALAECEATLAIEPENSAAIFKQANLLAFLRRYDESFDLHQAAEKLVPTSYPAKVSLAVDCYSWGDEAKARELLESALKDGPQLPMTYFYLGQLDRRAGNLQSAREHFEKTLTLPTPNTWPPSHVKHFLALTYREQLELARELKDDDLMHTAAKNWMKLEPDNEFIKKLLNTQ